MTRSLSSPCLMDPKSPRVTKNTYLSLSTHMKQFLLVTFFDTTVGIGSGTGQKAEGWTDMNVEIVDVRFFKGF